MHSFTVIRPIHENIPIWTLWIKTVLIIYSLLLWNWSKFGKLFLGCSNENYQYSLSKQRKHCTVVLSNNSVKWSPSRQRAAPPIIRPYAVWKQWEYKGHLFLSLACHWGNSKHLDPFGSRQLLLLTWRLFLKWSKHRRNNVILTGIKVRLVPKGFYRQKPQQKHFSSS